MRKSDWLWLLASSASVFSATPALAQVGGTVNAPSEAPPGQPAATDTGPQVDEIIVTAQKRAENLQNVPIAVSVVGAERLEAAGITRVEDIARIAPGLSMTVQGGRTLQPRIRGVGQVGGGLGVENPIAIYVDGVYNPTPSSFSFDNIAQVAVLKGPQGTLFGRNATGGLIQVTTLDPSQDLSGKITGTVGNRGLVGGTGYLTGGLAPNAAADLSIYYNNLQHGFGRNLSNNRKISDQNEFAARSKIKADLSDATTIILIGDYRRIKTTQPGYRHMYGTLPINGIPFTGGKFDIDSDVQPDGGNEQAGGSLTIEHEFPGVKFSSISAYRWNVDDTRLDNDGLPALTATSPTGAFATQGIVTATTHTRTFSQELQLTSDNSSKLKWTLGGFYFRLRGRLGPPVIINLTNGGVLITIDSNARTESYAAYGQATYALTDQLNFTAGLRYTTETRDVAGVQDFALFGFPFPTTQDTGRYKKNKLTWRLAADYRASDEALIYASYNRGFKSGGFNALSLPFRSYDPEVVDAYEAGLKLDLLSKRVRINSAFFYYDYSGLQAQVFQGGRVVTQNAANAKIYGLDVDMEAVVSRNFTINGGLSLLHHRFGLYRGAQITTPDLVNGGNIVSSADISGTRINNTPDWTLNLGAQYKVPIGSNELTLTADFYHNSGFYADAENRQRQGAYNLVNASVRYDIGDRYNISAWAKNIGNIAYASQIYASAAGDQIVVAPGRTFGVTAGVKF